MTEIVAEQLLREVNSELDREQRVTTVLDGESLDIVARWRGRKSIRWTVAVLLKVADDHLRELQTKGGQIENQNKPKGEHQKS